MATTTNYGWVTPDDTDLVKDGAAAIRTLGTSVDTTVHDNEALAIAKSIVDAKGDIIAATAADTVARLAVGANGTVLTANSATATGLEFATPAAGGMTLISTTTLSGATTTLSSIPQTFNSLFFIVTGATFDTANGQIVTWINTAGANGCTQVINRFEASVGQSASGAGDDPIYLQGNETGLRTNANNIFTCSIFNYTSATRFKAFSVASGYVKSNSNNMAISSIGSIRTNTAITQLVFGYDSGNAANAGTILLYGVK